MYMLWIKDGPSSPYGRRFPGQALDRDKWFSVLVPNANGGVQRYQSVRAAVAEGQFMMRDYLDFAVTPYRHDMAYRTERPTDAIELPQAA